MCCLYIIVKQVGQSACSHVGQTQLQSEVKPQSCSFTSLLQSFMTLISERHFRLLFLLTVAAHPQPSPTHISPILIWRGDAPAGLVLLPKGGFCSIPQFRNINPGSSLLLSSHHSLPSLSPVSRPQQVTMSGTGVWPHHPTRRFAVLWGFSSSTKATHTHTRAHQGRTSVCIISTRDPDYWQPASHHHK